MCQLLRNSEETHLLPRHIPNTIPNTYIFEIVKFYFLLNLLIQSNVSNCSTNMVHIGRIEFQF